MTKTITNEWKIEYNDRINKKQQQTKNDEISQKTKKKKNLNIKRMLEGTEEKMKLNVIQYLYENNHIRHICNTKQQ